MVVDCQRLKTKRIRQQLVARSYRETTDSGQKHWCDASTIAVASNLNKITAYWIGGCLVTAESVCLLRPGRTWRRRRAGEVDGFQSTLIFENVSPVSAVQGVHLLFIITDLPVWFGLETNVPGTI